MTGHLLMVGAGVMGRGYVEAARELGMRVTVVDRPAVRDRYLGIVDDFVTCPDSAEEVWLATAWSTAQRRTPDAVVAFSERHVLPAAWVQDALGLPGPSLRAAVASRNKGIQRVLLQLAGIGQPAFCLTGSAQDALTWADGRFPVVVKALRGSASDGVQLVRDAPSLTAAVSAWGGQTVLIEEFVPAPEYSWEGLVRDGVVLFGNYTAKTTTGPPEFVETGHLLPAVIDADVRRRWDEQIARAVAALHVRSSLVHLEFRAAPEQLWVMESAVRTPGDHLMELIGLAYGRDLYADVVRVAAGLPVPAVVPAVTSAAVQYVTCPPGRIEDVVGLDEAAAVPGVVRVGVDRGAGEIVGALQSSTDRVGYVISAGEDAQRSALTASQHIKVCLVGDVRAPQAAHDGTGVA